jgi:hypothetical protein
MNPIESQGPQQVGNEPIQQPQEKQVSKGEMRGRVVTFFRTIGSQIHALFEKVAGLISRNKPDASLKQLYDNLQKVDSNFSKIIEKADLTMKDLRVIRDELHVVKIHFNDVNQEVKDKDQKVFNDIKESLSGLEERLNSFTSKNLEKNTEVSLKELVEEEGLKEAEEEDLFFQTDATKSKDLLKALEKKEAAKELEGEMQTHKDEIHGILISYKNYQPNSNFGQMKKFIDNIAKQDPNYDKLLELTEKYTEVAQKLKQLK